MSAESSTQGGGEERLFQLVEELRAAREAGRTVDAAAWAERHGVSAEEVRAALEALELLDAGGEDEPHELPPPNLPDDYELLGELGRGGMGVVYRARQRSLDRDVAVKVLRPGELVFGDALRRFRREARALARLRHPHIVAVHEVGECDGSVYYSMDLVEGRTLAELVAVGELTPSRSVRLLRQVASAIAYSHAHGIVHRDLKPANVLVDADDAAFVVDFGLARDLAVSVELTRSGLVLGTPAYMAPEQARGDASAIGERTDVYALGAILYECLAGRAPFAGLPLVDLVHAVVHEEPTPPRRIAPAVPAALERVCLQALEKDPERRYPTARALLEDLERFEAGRAVRAQGPSNLRRAGLLLRRERSAVRATAITLLLVALAFWKLVLPRLGATREELMRRAGELEAQGASTAALVLYEEALDGRAPESPELAARVGALRLDAAGDARRAGDEEAARAELDAVRAALEPLFARAADEHRALRDGSRTVLRLPLAQAQAAMDAGAAAEVDEHWTDLERELTWVDERVSLSWRSGAPELEYGPEVDGRAFLVELALQSEPSLLDRHDVRQPAALSLIAHLIGSARGAELLARWTDRESGAVELLAALLRGLDELPEEARERLAPDYDSRRGWPELLAAQDQAALALAAATVAGDTTEGPAARAAALELAWLAADLPRVQDARGGTPPAEAPLEAFDDLDLAQPRRAAWQRVELVLEEFADDERAWTERALAWLRASCGLPDEARSAGAARAWWAELRRTPESACARGLRGALGLEAATAADARALLVELRAARGERRRQLHHLMRLVAPPGTRAPFFPAAARQEPANLVSLWERALGLEDDGPLRVRLALVAWSAGDGRARLEDSRTEALADDGTLQVELEHELEARWNGPTRAGGPAPRPLGWRVPPPEERDPWHVPIGLRGRLSWRASGRVLAWERAALPAAGSARRGVRSLSPGRAASPLDRVAVAARLAESAWHAEQPRTWALVLCRIEPGKAAEAEPWNLEDWRAALGAEIAAGAGTRGQTLDEELRLASWLPVPDELEALKTVSARRGLQAGASDLAARVMAGDGSFFDARDDAWRFRKHYHAERASLAWWRLVAARPAARAALDAGAREHLEAIEAALLREERAQVEGGLNLSQRVALWGFGAFVVALFGGLMYAAARQVWRHRHDRPEGVHEALWLALVVCVALAWETPLSGWAGAWVTALALAAAALAALRLRTLAGGRWSGVVGALHVVALVLWVAGVARGAHLGLLAGAAVSAALGLLALAPLSFELQPAANRSRRRLQLVFTAAFVLALALPLLADSVALLVAALFGAQAAESIPLAAPYAPDRGVLPIVGLFVWGVWMRTLGGPGRAGERRATGARAS